MCTYEHVRRVGGKMKSYSTEYAALALYTQIRLIRNRGSQARGERCGDLDRIPSYVD